MAGNLQEPALSTNMNDIAVLDSTKHWVTAVVQEQLHYWKITFIHWEEEGTHALWVFVVCGDLGAAFDQIGDGGVVTSLYCRYERSSIWWLKQWIGFKVLNDIPDKHFTRTFLVSVFAGDLLVEASEHEGWMTGCINMFIFEQCLKLAIIFKSLTRFEALQQSESNRWV